MISALHQFDLGAYDSGSINVGTPEWLTERLLDLILNRLQPDATEAEVRSALGEGQLRFMCSALVGLNLLRLERPPEWVPYLERALIGEYELCSVQLTSNGQLRYMTFPGCVIAMLPPTATTVDAERLIDGFNELTDTFPRTTHWMLDFSSCQTIPAPLVGYLVGFRHGLRAYKATMMCLWVRQEAVPTNLLPVMRNYFQIAEKGSFYLSKPVTDREAGSAVTV